MAWNTYIHTIDVGQGESSLIIAKDDGSGGESRTMLIDGGLSVYAATVHKFVAEKVSGPLNQMVFSHYDKDHSGGLMAILIADNLYNICDTIAMPACIYAKKAKDGSSKNTRPYLIAAAAATARATWAGGYNNISTKKDYSNIDCWTLYHSCYYSIDSSICSYDYQYSVSIK